MHVRDLFPSKYVTAEDLAGSDHQVVIAGIRVEKVGKEEEQRPVVYFQGHSKGMVLNRTNAKRIAESFGQDTDGWTGKMITVYPSECDFGGEVVPCIRVRAAADNNGTFSATPAPAVPASQPAQAPPPQPKPQHTSW